MTPTTFCAFKSEGGQIGKSWIEKWENVENYILLKKKNSYKNLTFDILNLVHPSSKTCR